MKPIYVGVIAAVVIGISVLAVMAFQVDDKPYSISANSLYEKIQSDELLFVIDIREEDQYKAGHIESSAHGSCDENSKKKILPRMQPDELWQRLQQNADVFLLDVREPDEVAQTRISSSVNIPLGEIFETETLSQIPKDKPVVLICASGNRAVVASFVLTNDGYDYQILEGGMKGWNSYLEENGLPEI